MNISRELRRKYTAEGLGNGKKEIKKKVADFLFMNRIAHTTHTRSNLPKSTCFLKVEPGPLVILLVDLFVFQNR